MSNPSTRKCTGCGITKSVRQFYDSCFSRCMDCKRDATNSYKRRTGYNVAYGRRKREEIAPG